MADKNLKRITKITYPGLALLALACFALSPRAQAVVPAPDGGYPDGNTAEGDNALLNLIQNNVANTAVGSDALSGWGAPGLGVGSFNTAVGAAALMNNYGASNTATGAFALYSNQNGGYNTANGDGALEFNTIGFYNTATGVYGLSRNTSGGNNTADGGEALMYNTTGSFNTATGYQALGNNTSGGNNTATGVRALAGAAFGNTGSFNTAIGVDALSKNTTASNNTATGIKALFNNTTGGQNTANGAGALSRNTTGNGNVAVGTTALQSNSGSFNLAIGFSAGANLTTGHDNIDIGALGVAGESNTMRIGTGHQTATFVAGIRGITTRNANAVPVLIDSAGQLGTASSSRRFKHEIKPMDKTSEAIFTVKPVTFQYKSDKTATPQFGLIAEEVAAVNPDLVVRDENGEIYAVRYDAVNAMLLNEFLKEHHKNEEQQATIAQLKSGIEALTATVKEQATQIRKVNAELQLQKPTPQTVKNP
jgi:hypothetical protein